MANKKKDKEHTRAQYTRNLELKLSNYVELMDKGFTTSDLIITNIRRLFPEAQVEQDIDGQVIIYTGIYEE